jgi:hypothetical protein
MGEQLSASQSSDGPPKIVMGTVYNNVTYYNGTVYNNVTYYNITNQNVTGGDDTFATNYSATYINVSVNNSRCLHLYHL